MARGGLFGLVGKGVAIGAEYREHRKDKEQAAAAASDQATQPTTTADGPSNTSTRQAEVLPAYSDSPSSTERRLDSGTPATDDKKTDELSSEEDIDSSDDLYSDTDTEYYSVEDDEELQELDDALYPADSKDLPSYEESEAQHEPVEELVRDVMSTSRPPITSTPSGTPLARPQLPCPVILPQRRPRKHARGFIRAYSPVLADCGISQDVFLKFLKNFHKSSQASPIFPIIQISAAIAGLAPSVIAMAVCTVAQIGAGIGAEVQSRKRTNNFLDCMNDELFKHAGLYAMIVKYKSDAEVRQSSSGLIGLVSQMRAEVADISTNQTATIARYTRSTSDDAASKSMDERMKNLRLASGTTKGSAMLPESAPLIFPDIDQKVATAGGPETFKDKTKDARKFMADYLDRRAQMEYAGQDPSSSLSVAQQQRGFKSSMADPNHPMHSGGLIALLSGGKVAPRIAMREGKMERALGRDERRIARGREPRARRRFGDAYHEELAQRVEGRRGGGFGGFAGRSRDIDAGEGSSRNALQYRAAAHGRRNRKGPLGAVKRVMREDVLYLMIVNLPDETELAEARMELERAQRH